MYVPNRENAEVPLRKVAEYVLNRNHPDASDKAEYFLSHGFFKERPEVFITALKHHIEAHKVASARTTPYGITYAVEGKFQTPDGQSASVRTVWFLESNGSNPRFVTAYPLKLR